MKIDFIRPNINNSDIQRMVKSIQTGWLAPGVQTKEVEKKLSSYLKIKNVVLTNSCTTALHASLIMCGVKEGDEVITSPMSWVATANVILYLKAKPVFVDVDETGCLNPNLIEAKITKKTKAIIPVYYCGQLADMKKINRIAKKHKLKVIEDAAHAPIKGIGTGDYACLSFHVAKNLTCGQGGAIVSRHPIDRRLLYHGVERKNGKRRMTGFGLKGEMTDFQAALLSGQIDRLSENLAKRRNVFDRYIEGLFFSGAGWILQKRKSAFHLFVVLVENRDKIREKLKKAGVETSIHYKPIHLEPYYQRLGYKRDCPVAESWGKKIISLPTYPDLNTKEVIKQLKKTL